MPSYEFMCNSCNELFIEFRSITKYGDPGFCPKCGREGTWVLSETAGFILKGKGFYQNDYKNKRD